MLRGAPSGRSRGRGGGFGGANSPFRPRERSPVQQIRRNRLDDESQAVGSNGRPQFGQNKNFRGGRGGPGNRFAPYSKPQPFGSTFKIQRDSTDQLPGLLNTPVYPNQVQRKHGSNDQAYQSVQPPIAQPYNNKTVQNGPSLAWERGNPWGSKNEEGSQRPSLLKPNYAAAGVSGNDNNSGSSNLGKTQQQRWGNFNNVPQQPPPPPPPVLRPQQLSPFETSCYPNPFSIQNIFTMQNPTMQPFMLNQSPQSFVAKAPPSGTNMPQMQPVLPPSENAQGCFVPSFNVDQPSFPSSGPQQYQSHQLNKQTNSLQANAAPVNSSNMQTGQLGIIQKAAVSYPRDANAAVVQPTQNSSFAHSTAGSWCSNATAQAYPGAVPEAVKTGCLKLSKEPVILKPQPPPPPKIGGLGLIAEEYSEKSFKSALESNAVSYESKFIELSGNFKLEVKTAPTIRTDNARKLYAFTIEFNNRLHSGVAQGNYFPSVDEARENAYQIACKKAETIFANTHERREQFSPANELKSPPSWSQESGIKDRESYADRSISNGPQLHSSDSQKCNESPLDVIGHPFENKFKDYMDILHMQCWLNTKQRSNRGQKLFGVEIEIQSYDRKFRHFDCGDYFSSQELAKESAFKSSCKKLETVFPKELNDYIFDDVTTPKQKAFMDLRSSLGLSVRCVPEIKLEANGKPVYAFNIEFRRGSDAEIVYGDFGSDQKASKERAYELATWRAKYLFGTEIDMLSIKKNSIPGPASSSSSEFPVTGAVNWEPPSKRLYNPHFVGARESEGAHAATLGLKSKPNPVPSLAMVSPRVQPAPSPLITTPFPSWSPSPPPSIPVDNVEYNRTYEYRFKELSYLLNVEYCLRKIPKFEGGHKIFAFEIKFQGKNGNLPLQHSMGEYCRDEALAKESAFKYACEQLSSRYDAQVSQHS